MLRTLKTRFNAVMQLPLQLQLASSFIYGNWKFFHTTLLAIICEICILYMMFNEFTPWFARFKKETYMYIWGHKNLEGKIPLLYHMWIPE